MTNFIKHKMRGKTPGEIVGWIILGVIGVIGLAALFGFAIMWLWNWLMPEIFGLTPLTYWQAVGLFILFKVLLGGCGSGSGSCSDSDKSRKPSKYSNSSCEKESKSEFFKWKHYDKFWKEEGNQAYKEYVERMDDNNPSEQ